MNNNEVSISDFISTFPLYREYTIYDTIIAHAKYGSLESETFDFYCAKCNGIKTFELIIDGHVRTFFDRTGNNVQRGYISNHYEGICKSCNTYKADFLIATSMKKLDGGRITHYDITHKKIGQYPAPRFTPNKIVDKYLTKEDKRNYNHAIDCLSRGLGMGALAYFRRLLENEIRRIIKDIAENGDENAMEIYNKYKNEKHLNTLIDNIFPHLPISLRDLGNNPIKFLYNEFSTGLHELSDEECIEKSNKINDLLGYVIEEIQRDKTTVKNIKNLMK